MENYVRKYIGEIKYIESGKVKPISLLVERVFDPNLGSSAKSSLKLESIVGKLVLDNNQKSLDAIGSIYEEKKDDLKIGFEADLPPTTEGASVLIFSGGKYHASGSKYSGIVYEHVTLNDGTLKKANQATFKLELIE